MTKYGTWVSYGGDAKIWLAAGLLAAGAGVAYAGIRLPLPARAARPGKTAATVMLVAWAAAVAVFVACLVFYARQEIIQYHLPLRKAAPPDRIAPLTFTAVMVTFLVILVRGSRDRGTALASAAIGAVAAPFIFEFPFDLIIMARVYPPLHPDPALYRALFFAPLLLMDIATLLLLLLTPLVQLTRATFFSFALMLGVFAVWALAGFAYASAPVPITLNIVSKILAFVTLFTLFFPRRPQATADPIPPGNERAQPA
jgi:hypothetical protein